MAYFVAYVVSEQGPPLDGEHIATGLGWVNFIEWAAPQTTQFPKAAHLAEEGWLDGHDLPDLEQELKAMLRLAPTPDDATVGAKLLEAVRARPPQTLALIITDGTPGEQEEDSPGQAGDITGNPEDQTHPGLQP